MRRNKNSAFFCFWEALVADFVFKISPNIMLGSYTTARLGQFVREWGSRFMLILDPVLKDFDVAEKIQKSLTDRKVDFFVFDSLSEGLDSDICAQALALARDSHVHGVISAGGTKTSNIARAVCALYNEPHDLYEFVDGAAPTTAPLPLIVLPTTMRDAFLFTDRTPIIDARSRQVKLMKVQQGLCKLALFDPNLSVSLTQNQVASMSLQTLCIAIEAYLSQKANFFSDTILEKAIELLSFGLDGSPTLKTTSPSEVLLAQGGCMTSFGVALSAIGPASILALAISGRFSIPRSLSTSILFPYFIEEAAGYKTDKLSKVAQIMRISTTGTTPEAAVSALADDIRNRLAMGNLPARLKDLSVSIEDLALAAEDAGQLELMNGLPRSMTTDDLFDLIKQAY